MPLVKLSHVTTYSYSQPASFDEHWIMVRPRERPDQYLISIHCGRLTPRGWGRDAMDTALITSFGPSILTQFQVYAKEVKA